MSETLKEILLLADVSTEDQLLLVLRTLRALHAKHRNINDDMNEWCAERKTTRATMRSRSRAKTISETRQELMSFLSTRGYSSVEIGNALNRDHSTVLEGVRAHRERAAKFKRDQAQARTDRGVAA